MQTTLLPVERILSLAELTAGKVLHPQGVYNMGLMPLHSGGYYGIFRNCTRNSRHLLGWPPMGESKYRNQLYQIYFNDSFGVSGFTAIETDLRVVHDVRISRLGLIGCEKVSETIYVPIRMHRKPSGNLVGQRVHDKPGKNWNILPDGWYDVGWLDNAGLARMRGCIPMVIDSPGPELRGSAPPFMIGERMITTYHTVTTEGDKRSYLHYFAELHPNPPYNIKALSTPFKLSRDGEAGRIQFLMACFPEPRHPENCIVSFGEADADNCVGRIKTADILGLLL